jgi:glutamyl-tRNA reductase
LSDLSSREQKVILALSQRIVNKILHRPTVRLKERANGQEATPYVEAVRDLFDLGAMEKGTHD